MNKLLDKLLTVPNILTISRMLLLPFFAFGFFMQSKAGLIISLSVFVFCCISDFLDGYYARAYKQTSKLGQMLDPLADKIVVSIALLFTVGFHIVSNYAIIPASVILCREIIISGIRDATEFSGHSFKTLFLSKFKTATQMLAISIAIAATIMQSQLFSIIGEILLWISSIIAIVSGCVYCKRHMFN